MAELPPLIVQLEKIFSLGKDRRKPIAQFHFQVLNRREQDKIINIQMSENASSWQNSFYKL